jgi:hypothetical protein
MFQKLTKLILRVSLFVELLIKALSIYVFFWIATHFVLLFSNTKTIANETEKLRENDVMDTSCLSGVVKVCGDYLCFHLSFVAVTGFIFFILICFLLRKIICFLLRKRSTVKQSIIRALSKTQSVYKSNAFL